MPLIGVHARRFVRLFVPSSRPVSPATAPSVASCQSQPVAAGIGRRHAARRPCRLAKQVPATARRADAVPAAGSRPAAGSLLFAAAATALAVVMVLLRGQPAEPEQFAWLTLTSTLGAWAVLVPAKLWEGKPEEQALAALCAVGRRSGVWRRGVRLRPAAAGESAVRGHAAMAKRARAGQFLQRARRLAADAGVSGVFWISCSCLLRWWRQADPVRPARLSLWTTACTVLVAWVLNLFWPFPQPWGIMVAATCRSPSSWPVRVGLLSLPGGR